MKNQSYKSILYSNGDELVAVVFEMLEIMLDCDLSEFRDEKKEDFLVKKQEYTLIGEIKGVSNNVRNEYISQLEVHYQRYQDNLQERNQKENVHQILIINPFRNEPPDKRKAIHENQIKYAKRNESLIVETVTLLKLFEMFLQKKITTEECTKLFVERTGILLVEDFAL